MQPTRYLLRYYSLLQIKMRFSVAQLFFAGLIGAAVASPIEYYADQRRADSLAARQYPGYPDSPYNYYGNGNSFASFQNDDEGGNAQTGDSGNVNGGSVTNTASGDGTVSNDDSCEYRAISEHLSL